MLVNDLYKTVTEETLTEIVSKEELTDIDDLFP
jgi:hypothetical protein